MPWSIRKDASHRVDVRVGEIYEVSFGSGGPTDSINVETRREVSRQMGTNSVARRSRYPSGHRALRAVLGGRSFGAFLALYLLFDLAVLNVEGWLGTLPSEVTAVAASARRAMEQLVDTVPSWLLGAQIGLLSVLSLALALVTLIAQRDDATRGRRR